MSGGKLAVIIATKGRAQLVAGLVRRLGAQSRPPDHIFVVGAQAEDIAALDAGQTGLTATVGRTGSALQRNDAIAMASDTYDTLAFFDDDFVPSRFWLQRAEELFAAAADLAGLTGLVLADGAGSAGVELEAGVALVESRDADPPPVFSVDESYGPYGCNMAFRTAAIGGLIFDERLPLYAWLEDADFGERVRARGRMGRADALWGVHLGNKTGRENGLRFGYSQIANAAYLTAKGSLPLKFTARRMAGNLVANALGALAPEPFIDRRGRLRGNLLALADVARGRLTPERILTL